MQKNRRRQYGDRPAEPASILEKKEFVRLQKKNKVIRLTGLKCACGSVWCQSCYTRKGGSKRFSDRISEMDYKAVRHVVLTVDLKKFGGSGQKAYETLRERKAVAQFIHDLKRTGKIKIKDWNWNLEWHEGGDPHWHLFMETKRGIKGRIGNEKLLRHWDYGLIREDFIKSRKHWLRFTDYFAGHGYFNPNYSVEDGKKEHQLELPEWAMKVTYRIRKTGSMVKKKTKKKESIDNDNNSEKDTIEEDQINEDKRNYREILESCGSATYCCIQQIYRETVWKKINIPYKCFRQFPGKYFEGKGFQIRMSLDDFIIFKALYDNDIEIQPGELEAA